MNNKTEKANHVQQPANQFQQIIRSFLPFWPVFLVLFVLTATYAVYYFKTTQPVFKAAASILIKDEKKGEEYSKMEQELKLFGNKNIVENQVEVISSTPVLTRVVRTLNLCTPVYTESGWKGYKISLAYEASPIQILAKNPERLASPKINKNYFTWNKDKNTVTVNNISYPIGEWVKTSFDSLQFVWNPNYRGPANYAPLKDTKYYFAIINQDAMVRGLTGAFSASAINKQATIVDLRVNDLNPKRAEAILNEIVKAYHEITIERTNQVALNTLAWIEKRLANVSQEMDSLESGIQDYRTGQQAVDIPEQARIALQNKQQADQQLIAYELQQVSLNEIGKYISSKKPGSGIAPSVINITDATLRDLLDKLALAESRYLQLKPTTGENSPILISAQQEIDKTRAMILENVNNQKANITSSIATLRNINNEYASKLNGMPKIERNLIEVSRSRGTKNDIYAFLLSKKEEVAFSINSTDYSSYFVDLPAALNGPVSPNINMIAFMVLFMPIAIGAAGITIREFLNSRILYRADIEKLTSIPIAGEIVFEKIDYSKVPARSFAFEQFRHLRHSLKFFADAESVVKRVLVTSSVMGEGKSYVSINLARSFARSGKKVALLELDLHKPKLRQLLGIEGDLPGITDYLSGTTNEKEIQVPVSGSSNFFLIPSGSDHDDASELLSSSNFEILLNYLDTQFDILIIDSAPVKAIADAYQIAQHVQLTLFVVRHNHTPKSVIQMLDNEMELRKLNHVAILFNGIKGRGYGKFSYGHGQGYGYDNKVTYEDYNKKKKK